MTPSVEMSIEADGWTADGDDPASWQTLAERAVAAAIDAAAPDLPVDGEVSLVLTDDATMSRLNGRWRGKPVPTNVLSFAANESPGDASDASFHPPTPLLGDIVLALETVRREARDEDKTVRDHAAHLIVHGFLHLVGHDHQNDAEAEAMEAAERRALATLGIADPYEATVPDHSGGSGTVTTAKETNA